MAQERIEVLIDTGGAAFDFRPASEVAKVFLRLAAAFIDGEGAPVANGQPIEIHDSQGFVCGTATILAPIVSRETRDKKASRSRARKKTGPGAGSPRAV